MNEWTRTSKSVHILICERKQMKHCAHNKFQANDKSSTERGYESSYANANNNLSWLSKCL